jgi:diguanylate cyclase (GGDEF)-like protein
MRYLALLNALFETVIVYDLSGRILDRAGTHFEIENVLNDPRFAALRDRLLDAVAGHGFETHFAIEGFGPARLRLAPHATDSGQNAAILALEGTQNQRPKLSGVEFDFVLSNMRQGFWRRNAKGAIVAANDYLASLLEYTSEEIIGRHISEFVPNYKDREGRWEVEFVTRSGIRKRAIVASSQIVGSKGRLKGHIEVITDVSAEHALRTRLVAEVQKMSKLAMTDILTGVANRFDFQAELERLLDEDTDEPFGLVMVDLDHFKEVNDAHGHAAGDQVLQEFAQRLKLAVRETDLVARLGGDEFAVLLPGARKELVSEVVDRLIERLRYETSIGNKTVKIAASIGWAHSDDGPATVLASADRRMYRDKRNRKGA